jgi:hypothetical protein
MYKWRTSDLVRDGVQLKPALPKRQLDFLSEMQTQFGESKLFQFSNLKVEHNFGSRLMPVFGTLMCTNFKLVFRPHDKRTAQTLQSDD